MTKRVAANVSVVLALALWPVAMLGFAYALGDPPPGTSAMQLRITKVVGPGILLSLAFAFLVAAAWLAGYSCTEARKRAAFSTLSCAVFVVALAALFLEDAL